MGEKIKVVIADDQYVARGFFEMYVKMSSEYELAASLATAEQAVNYQGWADRHPRGYAFKDVTVPAYDKVIRVVKEEASRLPQLGIIGWDFGVDKDGEPVFIELNIFPGQNQRSGGPTFGDLTEEVLQDVFVEKSLKDAFS